MDFDEIIKKLKEFKYEKILLETKINNISFIKSPSYSERVAGGIKKDIEQKYAEYSDLLKKLKEVEHNLNLLEQDFSKLLVDNLTSIDDILILKLYYIEGQNLFKIAKKLNYNYGYIRQRKQKATKKLKNL